MASPSAPKKRANAVASSSERNNKRLRSDDDEKIEDEITAAVPDVVIASDSTPVATQTVCATLVCGYGPVWATVRQDLCEAQPYFKAHQGGIHSNNSVALGLYINKYSEPRDLLDRNVLVTCVGGSRNLETNTRTANVPQNLPRIINAIGLPISVIIGKAHPKFGDLDFGNLIPSKALFVELGTFRVIDVWKEMVQPRGIDAPYPVWKIKLHTIRTDLKPWYWVDKDDVHSTTAQVPCQEFQCGYCGESSPKVFDNGSWVCLDHDCQNFFRVDGKLLTQTGDDGEDLRYTKAFLNKSEAFKRKMKALPADIHQMFQPLSNSDPENGEMLFGTEKELRVGFTCPICRGCNSQIFWDRKECKHCDFIQDSTPLPYPMDRIENEASKFTRSQQKGGKMLDGATIRIDTAHVTKFVEPADTMTELLIVYMIKSTEGNVIGTVVLERPTKASRVSPCGADKLLESIQEEGGKMMFRRNPARCPGSSSEELTRHFQSNWGVQYDFGVKPIPSVPFKEAPDIVLMSLAQLTDVGKRALGRSQMLVTREKFTLAEGSTLMEPYKPYNELLALAYRETDAISWHDDGEMQHQVVVKGKRRYAVTSRTIDVDYYKTPKFANKLGTSIEQLEASGDLPDRARAFKYGNTTLGV
ncbi:hypothetical protein VMCG_06814 [Cytospora schulzeri]|uniref:Alpha-ketoglutarate-dependent dioxygenase AlkB-like domain-containing protein n=1 Tax=Cytospora schulzeri TaxID=448051 RepID=A0A423W656_9PEZI|nr:hypothetical protein VMCG_06814 [Valsa malicola]